MKQLLLFEHVRSSFIELVWPSRPFRPAPSEQIKLPFFADQESDYQRRSPFASAGAVNTKVSGSPRRYLPDVRLMSIGSLLEVAQSQARTLRAPFRAWVGIDIGTDLPAELQLSAELLAEMAFSSCMVAQERAGRLRIIFGAPLLMRLATCSSISRDTPIPVYVTKASIDVSLVAAAVRSIPRQTSERRALATKLLQSPSTIQDHLNWGRLGVEAIALEIAGISKPTFSKLSRGGGDE